MTWHLFKQLPGSSYAATSTTYLEDQHPAGFHTTLALVSVNLKVEQARLETLMLFLKDHSDSA